MTELERLKLLWRNRVAEARAEMGEAALHYREVQAELVRTHSNDGHFALNRAMHTERIALHEYLRVTMIYYRLVMHNERPDEQP